MIRLDKDTTLETLLRQEALAKSGFYTGKLDNWWGPKSEAALNAWKRQFLLGDGTWLWAARIIGDDIVIEDASVTWFGGDDDPLDRGETASGVLTKGNPDLFGVALPVIPGHPSTEGSPLAFGQGLKPGIPWNSTVVLQREKLIGSAPLIDNGPAKSAHDPCDATQALFTFLGGRLSDGVITGVTITIVGGAKYVSA